MLKKMCTSSPTITNDDWKLYEAKYLGLMKMISMRITGDPISCHQDENFSDLTVSAVESLNIWKRKYPEKTYQEIIQDPLFDQYTKTCLWNLKNKKGANVTKKIVLYKNKISLSGLGDIK